VFERGLNDRGWIGFWSVARLRAGVTIGDEQPEVSAVATQAYADAEEPPQARVVGLRDALVERVRPTLVALLAAALAVLLIACVNVANLLLSRALLLGLFAAMALVLAAAGSAAVLAFTISQRIPDRHTDGLGADRRAILALVLGGAARIAFAGVAFGIPGAFMAGRLLARFLYG
jgi:hypothetical protein